MSLTTSAARALWDPQNQHRRFRLCKSHRFGSDSMRGMPSSCRKSRPLSDENQCILHGGTRRSCFLGSQDAWASLAVTSVDRAPTPDGGPEGRQQRPFCLLTPATWPPPPPSSHVGGPPLSTRPDPLGIWPNSHEVGRTRTRRPRLGGTLPRLGVEAGTDTLTGQLCRCRLHIGQQFVPDRHLHQRLPEAWKRTTAHAGHAGPLLVEPSPKLVEAIASLAKHSSNHVETSTSLAEANPASRQSLRSLGQIQPAPQQTWPTSAHNR